jgi:CHAD domain-containing protein
VRHEIIDGHEAIETLIAQSVHSQIDAFAQHAAEKVAGDPHALRIAGKSLRYTLEMAKHHGYTLPKGATGIFKRMQDSLGIWHDYVVLTERMLCETVECDLALHQPKLQSEILGLAQWTLHRAQSHLKKMEDLWNSRGEQLRGQLREAFPLTTPVETPVQETPTDAIAPLPQPAAPAA